MISKKINSLKNNENIAGYVFISPFLAGLLIFTLLPTLASLFISFTEYDMLSAPLFKGLVNYRTMFFEDSRYLKSLSVTFFYVFASVPLRLIFALIVAVALNSRLKMVGIYRTVYYLPSIIGGSVAVSVMWRELFGDSGVLNSLLGVLGLPDGISWLGNPNTAIWTIITLSVWQFGSSMLIFLAGLKQIPDSLYESAYIDGAAWPQRFIKITLPMLTPVIFFNLVMQVINSFMAFTQSYIITGGRPLDSTLFYALYLYRQAFEMFSMGYASAMAWVMLVIIGIFTALIFKSSSMWVYYESKSDF